MYVTVSEVSDFQSKVMVSICFFMAISEENRVCRLEPEMDQILVDEPYMVTKSGNIDDCMMDCRRNYLCMSATLDVTGDRPECRLYKSAVISSASPGSWVWRKSCDPGLTAFSFQQNNNKKI